VRSVNRRRRPERKVGLRRPAPWPGAFPPPAGASWSQSRPGGSGTIGWMVSVVRWVPASIALAAGSLLLACTGGSPAGADGGLSVGTVSRSQYWEYHDQVDEALCPTLLDDLDRHAQLVGGKIGLVLDPSDPYGFYKFVDVSALAASGACALPENGACAGNGSVYSTAYFYAHEQAHEYVYRAWGGYSIGLLNEGEAVALSCDPDFPVQPNVSPQQALGHPDWRSLLYLYGNSIEGYGAAGFWVTSLARRFGWSKVAELHRRIPAGISAADFEIAFATVFPTSMDESWSTALAVGSAPCQDDWRCVATPTSVGEDATPDCDGEMHRSVVVTDQGGVVVTVGGLDAEIILRSCADPAAPSYELARGGTPRTTHYAPLAPGSYTMVSNPTPTDVLFDGYLPPTLLGDACATGVTVTPDPTQYTYVDLAAGPVDGWLQVNGGGQSYEVAPYGLIGTGTPATVTGVLCDSCDPAASCIQLAYGQPTVVSIPDGAVVHFEGAISIPPSGSGWGYLLFVPPPVGAAAQAPPGTAAGALGAAP
jgi:hypothetical protein